eukprot:TRINITY_DN5538_c0_g1_i1.p1 TRINITY_DN5538_c0_g1~~TRINITY_DN5538_c0_g1_i1.p1  ORF type:complete len:349 (+),score=64.00 TRINITY_DN5538_c0_g1_i1:37-1083(+)
MGNKQTVEKAVSEEVLERERLSLGEFSKISNEVLAHILAMLDIRDVVTVSLLNRSLQNFAMQPYLWKYFYQQKFKYFSPTAFQASLSNDAFDYRALMKKEVLKGNTFTKEMRYLGEAFKIAKKSKEVSFNLAYNGRVATQRAVVPRCMWRGKHTIQFKLDSVISSDSVGICQHSVIAHGHALCVQLFTGDGTMNIHPTHTLVKKGRVRGRIVSGDTIKIELDLSESGSVCFFVNGKKWAEVRNLNETQEIGEIYSQYPLYLLGTKKKVDEDTYGNRPKSPNKETNDEKGKEKKEEEEEEEEQEQSEKEKHKDDEDSPKPNAKKNREPWHFFVSIKTYSKMKQRFSIIS